jgi:hypothetical protein
MADSSKIGRPDSADSGLLLHLVPGIVLRFQCDSQLDHFGFGITSIDGVPGACT